MHLHLQEELEALRSKAAQAGAAERQVEVLQAELAALQEHIQGLHSQGGCVAELEQEVSGCQACDMSATGR